MDILALFPAKHLSTISFQLPAVPFPDGAGPAVWVSDVPKGQIGATGTISPNCAFGASQTFTGNVCASLPPPPAPPHPRRGATIPPPLIRRGQGWSIAVPILCFHRHSRFVPQKTSLNNRLSALALPFPDGADPALWVCDVPKGQARADGTI
jgi:hypothetical protein